MDNSNGSSSKNVLRTAYRIKPVEEKNGVNNAVPTTITAPNAVAVSNERRTDWRSIYLCTVFTFTSSVQFTLFMTSLWPFMQILDKSSTITFFGAVIAMYSLSQIVASPILGIWSNRIERLKPPLIVCNAFMFVGNAMYCLVELFPAEHTRYVLMISRLVAGIGWAQVGLLKSFASSASVNEDRSRATAFVTGGVALGTTLGPAFQNLFTWIKYPGWTICFGANTCVNVSMFTAPAIFAVTMNVVLTFLLIFWFRESYVGILKRKSDKTVSDGPKVPPYDRVAVSVCYAMRFTQFFIFTNLETIGTAFAMMMFIWLPTDVVYWESIAHMIRGGLALAVYITYILFNLGKRVNDRLACLCSLFALLIFHVFTYSWPFLPDNVQTYDEKKFPPNATNQTDAVGCNLARFTWCNDLKQVNVWLYYTLMVFLIGLAFPNINVTMNTLFSRMIGPRMQSKQQGMLEMFGGMGRMLGPLLMGFLYRSYGPRAIWILESAEIGLMILLWLFCYKRLVPLKIPRFSVLEEEKKKRKSRQNTIEAITRASITDSSIG